MAENPLNIVAPLPPWLPDETFFSWASRYHRLSGNRIPADTSRALFGHWRRGAQHDFPTGLAEFCARSAYTLGNARTIVLTRTILPFYLPFRVPSAADDAVAALSEADRHGHVLKFRLGILTSRFRANHPLKACPACMARDREKHGVAYWHLANQAPGVWVCDQHASLLWQASVKSNGVERFGWLLPDASKLAPPHGMAPDSKASASLSEFGNLIRRLIKLPEGVSLDSGELSLTYTKALHDTKLAETASVNYLSLGASFCKAVAPLRLIPELQALPASPEEGAEQLRRWIGAPRGGTHPLRHIAIIHWLFSDWDSFWAAHLETVSRRPMSPLTPLSQTPAGPDPRKSAMDALLSNGKTISFAARQIGVDVKTAMAWAAMKGHQVRRRPKVLKGNAVTNLVTELKRGIAKTEAAKLFGISIQTVTHVLRSEVGLHEAWQQARFATKRDLERSEWQAAMTSAPGASTSELRVICPRAYAWLHRNDTTWLSRFRPQVTSNSSSSRSPRIDWDARDVVMSSEVRRVAAVLAELHGAERVKRWQICQALPELQSKLGALHRLPLTARALKETTRQRRSKNCESKLF